MAIPRMQVAPDHTAVATANVATVVGAGTTGNGSPISNGNGHGQPLPSRTTGDFCPSCGQIALVNEEGCHKCYVCGYSSC
jgi:hypothetical protein